MYVCMYVCMYILLIICKLRNNGLLTCTYMDVQTHTATHKMYVCMYVCIICYLHA